MNLPTPQTLRAESDAIIQREPWLATVLPDALSELQPCRECSALNTERGANLPDRQAVVRALEDLLAVFFPGCHAQGPLPKQAVAEVARSRLAVIAGTLRDMVQRIMIFHCERNLCTDCGDCRRFSESTLTRFLLRLGDIRRTLEADIEAAYEGDPAARSAMEIVMSYPGLMAVATYRIAHTLHGLGVPLLPRIMSEHSHSLTGIDIHPGATIGPGFFIDHGTGVVIGETCTIGRRVKLYQGVTLGALSFAKDEMGHLVKGIKRHPDVEDYVVIYAGATILGGETRIGHDSTIGGNVWLTHSVPPYSRVYNQQPKPLIKAGGADLERRSYVADPAFDWSI